MRLQVPVKTVYDTLVGVKTEKNEKLLNEIEDKPPVHTLADSLPQVKAEGVSHTLGVKEAEILVSCSGKHVRRGRTRDTKRNTSQSEA